MFDVIFKGGKVIDGSGRPGYQADVAIVGDEIKAIGHMTTEAAVEIDVRGFCLAPGFIDAHVHSDVLLLETGLCIPSLLQGVTTHIIGQDGVSCAPLTADTAAFFHQYFAAINGEAWDPNAWRSTEAYLKHLEDGLGMNVAYLLPHGNIRAAVMGLSDALPNEDQIAHMQQLIEAGLEQGAIGLSTGLDYIPCKYANTSELSRLAEVLQGGVFVAHMRSYRDQAIAAIREMREIAEVSGASVHISHFNCRAEIELPEVDAAMAAGTELTFDSYPYLAGCTILLLALPPALHGGSNEAMLAKLNDPAIINLLEAWLSGAAGSAKFSPTSAVLSYIASTENQHLLGLSVAEAAEKEQKPVAHFLRDLLLEEKLKVGVVSHQTWRHQEDIEAVSSHHLHMVGSDGIYLPGRPHPRGWGTFARYLKDFALEGNLMRLEEAIVHMTSRPARRFGLDRRGEIAEGFMADLVVFDPNNLSDQASYEVSRVAEGIEHVLINGQFAVKNGAVTDARSGRVLRGT